MKALFGLYALIFLSAVVQSCCEENLLITSDGYMSAWETVETEDGTGTSRNQIYTVTGEFQLYVDFHKKQVAANQYSFIGSAYATTCRENMLNSIDESSLFLAVDQSFVLNDDIIPPHTNLLDLQNSGIEETVNAEGWIYFNFTEDFFNSAILQNGDYTFSFEGRTSDNTELVSEMELMFSF